MSPDDRLARRLGATDATVIGIGSMIGAGVFSVFAPAAAAAGTGLLLGLAVAGIVAFCNATSTAQLAAADPTSGGAYTFGRQRLGPWPGFLAGWSFVIGKTASCAAMAMTFAAYVVPDVWQRPVAVAAVLVLAGVNYRGVTRTARLTTIIVAVVLLALLVFLAVTVTGGTPPAVSTPAGDHGWHGILQSGGLLFFALAGYARIATMGEEVRDPARTIPRAIITALAVVVVLYAAIALVLLRMLGPVALAGSGSPLLDVATASGHAWLPPLVRIAAAAACLGALLALIAGVGRTSLAMAREGDLPAPLAAVHPRYRVPHRAEVTVALVVSLLVVVSDLRAVIGFSSFGVLLYYAVANAAALRQPPAERRWPRGLPVLGLVGCLVLVVTLPAGALLTGTGVLAVGVAYRAWRVVAHRA